MSADSKVFVPNTANPADAVDVLEVQHLRVVDARTEALGVVVVSDEAEPPVDGTCPPVSEQLGERALRAFKFNATERVYVTPEDQEVFKGRFTSRQREVIAKLFDSPCTIAYQIGIKEDSVGSHIRNAKVAIHTESTPYLAVMAARHGMIPLKDIPGGLTRYLEEEQRILIRECYQMDHEEAAKRLSEIEGKTVTPEAVAIRWSKVYRVFREKSGKNVSNQTQATLIAYKDGLIA